MTTNYIVCSNTGNINNGLRLLHKKDSWQKIYPAADVFTGLDGDTTRSAGAASGKCLFKFVAMAQYLDAATGYASMEGSTAEGTGQSVKVWSQPTSAVLSQLKITDPEGTAFDVVWVSGYMQAAMTNRTHGATEWMSVAVELRQR